MIAWIASWFTPFWIGVYLVWTAIPFWFTIYSKRYLKGTPELNK